VLEIGALENRNYVTSKADNDSDTVQADPVYDSANCSLGILGDDAHVSKAYGGSADNTKNISVVPKVGPISSSRIRDMQITEKNVVASSEKNNGKLQEGIVIVPCRSLSISFFQQMSIRYILI
jgi:hypothetical protein